MIKLACNYYTETEELVKDNLIDIDYFKFPSLGFHGAIQKDLSLYEKFILDKKKIKPILLHGLYPSPHNICSPYFKNELRVDIVQRLLELSETPIISIHFDGAEENMSKNQIIDIAVDNILYMKDKFKEVEFITIENIEKGKSTYVTDPDIITKVTEESGINFLLDISHAVWAANERKEDLHKYLHRLPLKKVHEIHINGWAEKDGDIMCHIKINNEGYDILRSLLDICSPLIVTLEYGRNDDRIGLGCPLIKPDGINNDAKAEIVEQVNKLRELIGR